MRKSREEIVKQTGELVDLVGELFDEREETWRKFCKCSRDLKEVEKELAEANYKIEQAKDYMIGYLMNESNKYIITHAIKSEFAEVLKLLKGGNNE